MTSAFIGQDRVLHFGRDTYRAAIGRTGIIDHKMEGDGATPAGILTLRRVLYRADRIPRPQASVPIEPLSPQDGWCDDPADPKYNQAVHLPYSGHHEEMWRGDGLYDLVGVLGWNDSPVLRGRGSAIFLHCASPDYAPTDGCVAIARPDLVRVLAAALTVVQVG